jgi:AmiR/NasT family two-component response regulator
MGITRIASPNGPPKSDTIAPSVRPAGALHVLAADPDPDAQAYYRDALPRLGHEVCLARTGPELLEAARVLEPDVLVLALDLPGTDGIAVAETVCRERPVPVVLVADAFEPVDVARALSDGWVMACLTRPVLADALGATLAVAVRRFHDLQTARAEAAALRQTLDERKVIERAKEVVARRIGCPEAEAYRRLRTRASHTNRRLAEVAAEVLAAEAAFAPLEAESRASGAA